MIRLVTDPDGFLRGVERRGSLAGAVAVVVLTGLVPAVEQTVYATTASGPGPFTLLYFVLYPVLLCLLWVILAVLFYGVSVPFSDGGGFLSTLKLTGWGFFPSIVSNGLTLLVAAVLVYLTGVSGATAGLVSEKVAASAVYRVLQPTAFGVVFVAWNAMLWTFGIRHARETSLSEAAVVVGVPIGLVVAAAFVFTWL